MISSARLGDQHACPLPGHGITPVATASGDVLINALNAARVGDLCACGAVIVAGFPSILLNGRPMAHLGSPTSHGGMLMTGSENVGGGFAADAGAGARAIDFSRLGILRPDGTLDPQRLEVLLADPDLAGKAEAAGAVVDVLAPQINPQWPETHAYIDAKGDVDTSPESGTDAVRIKPRASD
ncbi:membrane protein [Pseudomonas syringae]|nr:membrane protein [Pseudomonas syringae]